MSIEADPSVQDGTALLVFHNQANAFEFLNASRPFLPSLPQRIGIMIRNRDPEAPVVLRVPPDRLREMAAHLAETIVPGIRQGMKADTAAYGAMLLDIHNYLDESVLPAGSTELSHPPEPRLPDITPPTDQG